MIVDLRSRGWRINPKIEILKSREPAMRLRTVILWTLAMVTPAAPAFGGGVATLELSSPSSGHLVAPGQQIEWTITVSLSAGDNLGLALIAVDLVQDPANPELFDLPSAVGLPAGMAGFDLPAGIANRASGGGSAYGGTPTGTSGMQNLRQIGGSQNTLGVVPLAGIGEDIVVETGVGQGGPQVIASGSFAAPVTLGDYTFFLVDPIVNTLVQEMAGPPALWLVGEATISLGGAMGFRVTACPADFDGDGQVRVPDLIFLLGTWGTCVGDCPADFDGSGDVRVPDLIFLLGEWGDCP